MSTTRKNIEIGEVNNGGIDRLRNMIEEISPHQKIINGIEVSVLKDIYRIIDEISLKDQQSSGKPLAKY